MPTLRPFAPLLTLLALGACGGGYPELVPTASLLSGTGAPPPTSTEATAEATAALNARAATLQAEAEALRTTPVIDPGSLPAPAVPPTD